MFQLKLVQLNLSEIYYRTTSSICGIRSDLSSCILTEARACRTIGKFLVLPGCWGSKIKSFGPSKIDDSMRVEMTVKKVAEKRAETDGQGEEVSGRVSGGKQRVWWKRGISEEKPRLVGTKLDQLDAWQRRRGISRGSENNVADLSRAVPCMIFVMISFNAATSEQIYLDKGGHSEVTFGY